MSNTIPNLYAWAGEMPAIERLMELFYSRVPGEAPMAAWDRGPP